MKGWNSRFYYWKKLIKERKTDMYTTRPWTQSANHDGSSLHPLHNTSRSSQDASGSAFKFLVGRNEEWHS